MIQEFVNCFIASEIKTKVEITEHFDDYKSLVKKVIEIISDKDTYEDPDPNRVHEIDDGDYQGTYIYLIAAKGYQPSDYWLVDVSYGSCSGCDTLQSTRGYSEDPPTEEQRDKYWTLMLHVVQKLRKVAGYELAEGEAKQ